MICICLQIWPDLNVYVHKLKYYIYLCTDIFILIHMMLWWLNTISNMLAEPVTLANIADRRWQIFGKKFVGGVTGNACWEKLSKTKRSRGRWQKKKYHLSSLKNSRDAEFQTQAERDPWDGRSQESLISPVNLFYFTAHFLLQFLSAKDQRA